MADLELVLNQIRTFRPVTIVVGVLLIAMALGGAFLPVGPGEAAWVPYGKWVMLLSLLGLGVWLLRTGLRPAEDHPAVVLLRDTPERIVWFYLELVKKNGHPSATRLHLGTDTGTKLVAPLPLGPDGERRGLALARAAAPRATSGFSPELKAQFKRDPSSLRRA